MSRIARSLVLIALVVVWCGAAWGAAAPKYQMRQAPIKVDSRDFISAPPGTQSFGRPVAVGATAAVLPLPVSPGLQVGDTYYDYQHNGSVGRQVDKGPGPAGANYVQCTWMKSPGPSVSVRTVNWNRTSVAGSPTNFTLANGKVIKRLPLASALLPGGFEFAAVRPGYTNYRNRPSGKGMGIFHDAPESGGVQFDEVQTDQSVGAGVFPAAGTYKLPSPPGPQYIADGAIWPKQTVSTCGADLVHHAIGTWSGAANEIWYWRGIINDATGAVTWAVGNPVKIDPVDAFITAVIEARGSDVYIAMLKNVNTTNADVVYYKSTDCGVSWGPMVNVTNYSSTGDEGGYLEMNAVIDPAGDLHLIWNTFPASGQTTPTNLYHWSPGTGIRLITSAGWINKCNNGALGTSNGNGAGTNNLAIAEPNLSVKPASVPWMSGTELLYAVWTQYGPTNNDCSTVDAVGTLGGGVNGEIFCSTSSNSGLTWDRPVNLTGTVTPNALPDSAMSESWVTTASSADSGVYISYVEDRHAGPIVFGGGAWTLNPYKVLAAEARAPVLEPVIAVSPINFIELNAKPSGGSNSVNLNIISVGNADLNFTVTVTNDNGGASHVQVNGMGAYAGAITAGGPPNVVNVTFDALGLPDPSEHNWRLEVTSNDPTNNPSQGGTPIDVNLQVFAAEVWFACTNDTLSTGLHRMRVSSCLEMGARGTTGTGFINYATEAEWMYSGSPLVSRVKDGDTVSYHNAFMGQADRTRALNKSFRPRTAFNIKRDSAVTVGDSTYVTDVAHGTSTTTDSTINLAYEMHFFKSPQLAHGAVWKFNMTNVTGSTMNNVHWGVIADIDVDPDAGDNAGIGSQSKGYIGGVGGVSDTAGNFTPNTNYMALFHLPLGATCVKTGARAAQAIGNPDYVYPSGGFHVDSIYALCERFGGLASWGVNIYQDTVVNADDLSILLVTAYRQNLVPATPVRWGYGLATSDVSLTDLEDLIERLRAAANANCRLGCPITKTGDVNNNGVITSADIIYLVNFVFKGGPAPAPCAAAGDVNCNGAVTSADIIFLVNFVFKGGPTPCDACTSTLAAAC